MLKLIVQFCHTGEEYIRKTRLMRSLHDVKKIHTESVDCVCPNVSTREPLEGF
jgi:hypothetical protein